MAKADTTDASTAPADTDTPVAKTARFTAPAHVSAITLSTGRIIAVDGDGQSDVPADLSFDERNQLTRAGFVPA